MTAPRTQPRGPARVRPMTPGIPHAARIRAYLAGVVVTAGLCGVAWRAWALQVDDGDRYRALAARQHAQTVGIPAPRGDILDAQGRPLAVSAAADSIWANPREIRDVTDTADRLAKLIGGDPVTLEAKLGGDHRFVWLARHVTPELARAVHDAKLPGIEVSKEPRRWYPGKTIGGTVIGHSDIDGNGLDGVELAMNGQLLGHRGEGVALRDVRGKKMFADGIERPEPGATVQLSLDASIQATAEAAVEEAVRVNRARSGVAVVLEVGTGRVLAMASAPVRDPNASGGSGTAGAGDSQGSARNRAVADSYEAGSVMKVFSIAAALDDGLVTPETELEIGGGQLKLPGRAVPIRDVEHDLYLDVAGIIKRSSNVGAAKIALRFGSAKLYAALKRFGFGKRTGIELPGEQPGLLRDGAKWRDVELATISFGYGLTVTPLQITAALAAFGDHGIYHEPRVVDRVVDPDGTLLYQATPAARRIVSDRTATQMRAMLASVFEGGKLAGTAAKIVVPGFRCGGKTGTANKYDPALKGYSIDHYLSTFTGLAPIDHPRLAITVLIDDPTGGDHFGAKVAGPVFARIASEALRYLGVPGTPDVCPPPVPGALPSIEPRTCLPAAPGAPAAPARPAPAPPVAAAPAAPAHPAPGLPASAPRPPTAPGAPSSDASNAPGASGASNASGASGASGPPGIPGASNGAGPAPVGPSLMIPDFRGMGMARAIAAARAAHLSIAVSGTGRVTAQVPAPGLHERSTISPHPSVEAAPRVTLQFSDGNSTVSGSAAGAP